MKTPLEDTNLYAWLNALARDGGTLITLAEALATIVQRSVVIEDSSLRILAHVLTEPLDNLRRASVLHGRSDPFVSQRLLRTGIYEQMKEEMRPLPVPPFPSLGMSLGRMVAPIVVSREIYGYIWVISEGVSAEVLVPALEQAALVAALIMFKERIDKETETALRNEFFQQMLKQKPLAPTLLDQARRLAIRPEKPHQVIVVHGVPRAGGSSQPLYRDVSEWFVQRPRPPFAIWHDDRVVVILEGEQAEELARQMVAESGHPARSLLLGVSQVAWSLEEIAGRYRQAREAIQIALRLGQREGVVTFTDLGLLHWLYHLPPDVLATNPFLGHIGRLVEYDQRRRTELVKTLEAYLDHGANLVDTAADLHIHRNTLVHRLRRIEELIGIDLRDPQVRLNLHVGVKQHRLTS